MSDVENCYEDATISYINTLVIPLILAHISKSRIADTTKLQIAFFKNEKH